MLHRHSTEPTDRSMPPVMITIGHAERDDGDEGEVAGDVEEIVGGREGIGRERQKDAGDDERQEHPEGLARREPGEPGMLLLLDRYVELDCHGSNLECSGAATRRR